MLTRESWAKAVLFLKETYGRGFELSADGIEIWYQLLSEQDFNDRQVIDAVKHVCLTTRAFPALADIVSAIRAIDAQSSPGSFWAEAWQFALDHCHEFLYPACRGGVPVLPEIEPLTLTTVEQFGGWQAIMSIQTNDLVGHRSQFREIYKAAAKLRKVRLEKLDKIMALNTDFLKSIPEPQKGEN